jgi:hypothetical protein
MSNKAYFVTFKGEGEQAAQFGQHLTQWLGSTFEADAYSISEATAPVGLHVVPNDTQDVDNTENACTTEGGNCPPSALATGT